MESEVILDFNVLDPKRHSAVIFKGNSDHKTVATELNVRPSDSSILSASSKGHGLDNKKGSASSGRMLNKTIRRRGSHFKIAENSRVSLTDVVNSMAKLIGEQVETLTDSVSTNEEGDKASIGL
ncbi:hypothetical protein PVK06_021532 [Gossypium arboreum]|uniref:Uncharacterized protein n=1 Tax=Gossypium arboreum TaxID=29729 RepID=A0ABR0PQ99_GOSAR|nr:hypothetical protein PVK06_021532 [Gossypium arboreum]